MTCNKNIDLKWGKKLPELHIAIVLKERLLDRHPIVVSGRLIREAFSLSMAQEKEQLTGFPRGIKREWKIRGRPTGPAKAEKHQHAKLTDTGWSDFHVQ